MRTTYRDDLRRCVVTLVDGGGRIITSYDSVQNAGGSFAGIPTLAQSIEAVRLLLRNRLLTLAQPGFAEKAPANVIADAQRQVDEAQAILTRLEGA